jgi:hypothetical protein
MERMTSELPPALPTGTITFPFTDIEGSTPLWERESAAMGAAVARHHAILHAAAEAHQLLGESVTAFREVGHRENLGFAMAVLGYAARGLGQPPQARQHLNEALQIVADIRAFVPFVLALDRDATVTRLLAELGEHEVGDNPPS